MTAERLTDNPRATDSNANALSNAKWYFYATGTTTPQTVYSDAALSVPLSNPVVADAGGKFAEIYFDASLQYRGILKDALGTTIKDVDPINAGTFSELASTASGKGGDLISFIQSGVGAVARTVLKKERESLSVFDFIPVADHAAIQDGTTTTDVTSYINLALTYALTTAYHEKTIKFPAGTYRVSQFNLRDKSFIRLHAEGTVNITGIDGTQVWLMGDDRFDDFGHLESYTQNLRITGGPWLIGPAAGQNYAVGLKLQNFKDSVFENLSVSGTYVPVGGVGDRKAVDIQLSFDNAYYNCTFGYPGAPIGADKSYNVFMGSDNCNNNRFYNLRISGGGGTVTNTVGMHIEGAGNAVLGADISAIHTAMEMNAARGFLASSFYCESISRAVNVTFLSTGCIFFPGYVDIIDNGTAYDFGSTGNIQTEGFQVLGGNHRFTAVGTTLIKKGSDATHGNCYGLTFQPGLESTNLPVTMSVGLDTGSAGATWLDAFELTASKINFPDTSIASTCATTLDCYKEQNLTNFGIKAGATAQTTSSAVKVTKVGRLVTVDGYVLMGAAVAGAGNLTITGLPYPSASLSAVTLSINNVTYTGTPSAYINGSVIELYTTTEAGVRSALTQANLAANSEIEFSVTYNATS